MPTPIHPCRTTQPPPLDDSSHEAGLHGGRAQGNGQRSNRGPRDQRENVLRQDGALTIAHELRQPLFTISVAAERLRVLCLRSGEAAGEAGAALERIVGQVERAQIIIARTLGDRAASDGAGAARPADIAQAARAAIGYIGEMLESAQASVRLRCDGQVWIDIDQTAIEQIFVNLLRNAAEAIALRRERGWNGPGRIDIAISRAGASVRAVVADNGAGLAPAAGHGKGDSAARRRGFGLGLSICRELLAPAGGTLHLRAGAAGGARAEIAVPRVASPRPSDVVAT